MKRSVGVLCLGALATGVLVVTPVAAVSSPPRTPEVAELSEPVERPALVDPSWRPPAGSERLPLPTGVPEAARLGGPEPIAMRGKFEGSAPKQHDGRTPADLPANTAADAGQVAGWSRAAGPAPARVSPRPAGIVGSVWWLPGPGWTPRVTASSPSARTFPGGAFDATPGRNVDVVFGGRNSAGTALNDTWTFDGYTWTQQSPATSPSARSAAVMVYDPVRDQVVLFGGLSSTGTVLSDTWAWNGSTWTQKFPATTPTARKAAAATWVGSSSSGDVYMFGGYSSSAALNDLWKWNGTNWASVSTTGAPSIRGEAAMAYDSATSEVVLFGGSTFAGTLKDDTWTLSGTTWTQESPAGHPDARRSHSMIYSGEFGAVQLFGGQDSGNYFGEAWIWYGGNWSYMGSQNGILPLAGQAVMQSPDPVSSPDKPKAGMVTFFGGLDWSGNAHAGTYSYDWLAAGDRGDYATDAFPLSDQTQVFVHRASASARVRTSDITLQGVDGPFGVGRYYHSRIGGWSSTLSWGWTWDTGADVNLSEINGDKVLSGFQGRTWWFDETSPGSGTYTSPPGINASWSVNGSGDHVMTLNDSGRKLTFSFGQLISDEDRDGNQVTFTYDGNGRTDTITDTLGKTLTFSYAASYPGTTTITDSASRVLSYDYNSWGDLESFTNADGKTTFYDYAAWDQLGKITTPDGMETTLDHPSATQTTLTRVTNVGAQTGPTTTWTQNAPTVTGAAVKTTVTDPLSHNLYDETNWQTASLQTTDANGRLRSTEWDPNSLPLTLQGDASTSVFTYAYNLNRMPLAATAPSSNGTNSAAEAESFYGHGSFPYLPSSGTDPQGNCTAMQYNTVGNLAQVNTGVTPGGSSGCDNSTSGVQLGYHYEGDPSVTCGGRPGQLCESVDGNGNSTTYAYDVDGNLTTVTPPSPLGATTIDYDVLNRSIKVTDGVGNVTRTIYDAQDRVVEILYNNTTSCPNHTNCSEYVYDDNGRIDYRITAQGTTNYTYDIIGRLIETALPGAFPNNCPTFSGIRYSYDDADNLTSLCDAQGTISYTYDNANQLTKLQEPGGNCAATPVTGACTKFEYVDASNVYHDGRVTKITYPPGTGVVTTNTYDQAENLTNISTMKGVTTLQNTSYTWAQGTNDRTVKQSQTVSGSSLYYRYDTRNQLCWAAPATSANACSTRPSSAYGYTYDNAGNRTSETSTGGTVTNYAFNAANQLCKSVTGGAATCSSPNFTYDSNGNRLTGVGSPTWTYNNRNQASAYVPSGGGSSVNIAYHDTDSTEQATIGTGTYAFSPLGLAAETNPTRTVAYTRTHTGRLISQRISGASQYYLLDNLGSVVGMFDSTGTVTNTYTYDPIGRQLSATGAGQSSNYRYATGYLLGSTGLYKMGTRYYDPNNSGTWTQQDPSRQDVNPYTYVGANPVTYNDPTGLAWWKTALKVVGYGVTALSTGVLISTCSAGTLFIGTAACFVGGTAWGYVVNEMWSEGVDGL